MFVPEEGETALDLLTRAQARASLADLETEMDLDLDFFRQRSWEKVDARDGSGQRVDNPACIDPACDGECEAAQLEAAQLQEQFLANVELSRLAPPSTSLEVETGLRGVVRRSRE